jgi:transcription factor IIIB subunit 2
MAPQHCPSCGSTELELQDAQGDTVCLQCGTVLEESNIVSAVEFQETAGGAR